MYGRRELQVVLWDPADLQAAELHPAVFTSGGTTASGVFTSGRCISGRCTSSRFYRCLVKLQCHRFVDFATTDLHFSPCFVPYLEFLLSIGLQTIGVPKVLRFFPGTEPIPKREDIGKR